MAGKRVLQIAHVTPARARIHQRFRALARISL